MILNGLSIEDVELPRGREEDSWKNKNLLLAIKKNIVKSTLMIKLKMNGGLKLMLLSGAFLLHHYRHSFILMFLSAINNATLALHLTYAYTYQGLVNIYGNTGLGNLQRDQ